MRRRASCSRAGSAGRARARRRARPVGPHAELRRPRWAGRARAADSSAASASRTTAPGASAPTSARTPAPRRTACASPAPRARTSRRSSRSTPTPPQRPGRRSRRRPSSRRGARSPTRDGTVHRLWRVTDPDAIAAVQAATRDAELLIADGHHRYETMHAYAEEIGGEGDHRYMLMCLVALEDPGLTVFPTHRLVRRPRRGAPGGARAGAAARLRHLEVRSRTSPRPRRGHRCSSATSTRDERPCG